MKYLRTLAFVVLAGLAIVATVQADEWNKKTIITISEAVRMPSCCNHEHSVTLEPGTYVMKLVDSPSNRHIVQVFDKDEKHVITTVLAIPNYRLQPRGKTVINFWEVPAGQTKPMRAWFYPGDNFGQEFAYPKETAVTIAASVKETVPISSANSEQELKTEKIAVAEPSGQEAEPEKTPAYVKPEPTPEPTPEPQATPAPTTPEPAPTELPKTASPMPLIGLIGLLSSAGLAATIRFRRKR